MTLEKGRKIHVFTVICIVIVAYMLLHSYYIRVINERDRLEAKRMKQAIATVVARNVGSDLTYDNGRIHWTIANAIIVKQGIAENLALGNTSVPFPREKGYYYYMYLESPYTVVKLPYKSKSHPQIDKDIVTDDYLNKSYSPKEYAQISGVPEVLESYEFNKELYPTKNVVVCLNV